ncbi:MAG: DNA replication protein DnaC, partial [Lachnospiraceae bacterium]|nr:DNA replication protein DnaC [Lachnospiraceae bacterium]
MPLKNSQFNAILRNYDERQSEMRRLLDEREKEIEEKIPEYGKLNEQVINNSMEYARAALLARKSAEGINSLEQLKRANRELAERKSRLLVENGYPKDYLLPVYKCPDCKDTGYIGTRQCHCFKQAVVDLLYRQSNLGPILEEENYDTFSFSYYSNRTKNDKTGLTPLENMRRIYDYTKKFINNFDSSYENLFFYGNAGLGKTFLSHCIAKELLNSAHTVLYLTAYELFNILGKNMR